MGLGKIYFSYFFGNFSKKLFNFSLAVFLSNYLNISSIFCFFLHYFQYLSVYFFNDYIDREDDKKRKFIIKDKLLLDKKTLLNLSILHFLFPFIVISILFGQKLALLSSLVVSVGIIRSLIKKRIFRELSLGLLQLLQIFFFFNTLGKVNLFINYFFIILFYACTYSFAYYAHKIPEWGINNGKLIFYILLSITNLILALPDLNNFKALLIIFLCLICKYGIYIIFSRKISTEEYVYILRRGAIPMGTISVILLLTSILNIQIYEIAYSSKVAYISVVNSTIKKIIKNIVSYY